MEPYPLFQPPAELSFFSTKEHLAWTKAEARQFYFWLLSVVEQRTENVLRFLNCPLSGNAAAVLAEAGEKAAAWFRKAAFATTRKAICTVPNPERQTNILADPYILVRRDIPHLTGTGNSLAIDMSLLVARLLIRDHAPALQWAVITHPKRYINQNLTVVLALNERDFGPVIGAASPAISILEGTYRADAVWAQIYSTMRDAASQRVADAPILRFWTPER